jgi:maleylacetate reductase
MQPRDGFELDGEQRVVFAIGAEARVAAELQRLGAERVLLVCQRHHRAGAERVAKALGARCVGIFAGARQHVPREVANSAAARATELSADWVLAHGGGTSVGVAKAVALDVPLRVAAVPTTYSGSECTDIWGLSHEGAKRTGRDPRVLPSLIVYDPMLSRELPLVLSAQSLLNALAHSAEALYAPDASDEALRSARDSVAPVARALRGLVRERRDLDARSDALYGAFLAGSALRGASMALHHKLCHTLGGSFELPHAATHALLLPHVLAFNAPAAPRAMAVLARGFQSDDPPRAMWQLSRELGLASTLPDIGFGEDDIERAAGLVMQRRYANPRPFTGDDIAALLRRAVHGRCPSWRIDPATAEQVDG